ncbi:MAG: nucleotide pyrophosphohydrolase [Gammaproteobacteria bacterium]|nr:nucleotide pyrophosphohydrolase [Gammaproteobacteria bacterium]MDH3465787.1 nucleotide pyrophosphohydrolase [Gammaproteobacteria bacterium]
MRNAAIDDLPKLASVVRRFAEDRDWTQFHSPKNLVMALSVEVAELVEYFQWMTEAQSHRPSANQHRAIALELADVLIYLVRIADILKVDLMATAAAKIELNNQKYPADLVRGKSNKYNDY